MQHPRRYVLVVFNVDFNFTFAGGLQDVDGASGVCAYTVEATPAIRPWWRHKKMDTGGH